MTEHPHRRAEDRAVENGATEGSQAGKDPDPSKRSSRDFFQKFRQPLIGLGLAGAAAPLINAGKTVRVDEGATAAEQPDIAAAAEVEGADLEEKIATRIGETRAVDLREEAVVSAVDRYGIERDLAESIYDKAAEAGIEPKLAYGLVKTESSFRQRAVSHVGARGFTQVMPRTAKWLRPGTTAEDLYDRDVNLGLGFKYLNQLIDKYRGDVELALLAYNRGPGTVDKILKRGGDPDNGYARKVMGG
jgi:soluble lytic murein transglycosylase-like protein